MLLTNSQSGLLRNSQFSGSAGEGYENVKITFINNGNVIKELHLKKMSMIKDE